VGRSSNSTCGCTNGQRTGALRTRVLRGPIWRSKLGRPPDTSGRADSGRREMHANGVARVHESCGGGSVGGRAGDLRCARAGASTTVEAEGAT
jgi:hypothetical protein